MAHAQNEAAKSTLRSSSTLHVTSSAFADGATIPKKFTADGDDVSPAIAWTRPPPTTKSIAIVCEDPDAPSGLFFHWTIWNLPADKSELAENVPSTGDPEDYGQGTNGFGRVGYGGPKPPPGKPHRYFFHVYALDTKLDLEPGASRRDFDRAAEGHIVATGTLMGLYGRDGKES
ncbi:MAG TPA: YbhB/YbcL family Raf kinase inhibitor-like protein [Polyangiaceae bacterium]